jgi:hypothetical protein
MTLGRCLSASGMKNGDKGHAAPARAAAMGSTCTAKSLGAMYKRTVAPKGDPPPFEGSRPYVPSTKRGS